MNVKNDLEMSTVPEQYIKESEFLCSNDFKYKQTSSYANDNKTFKLPLNINQQDKRLLTNVEPVKTQSNLLNSSIKFDQPELGRILHTAE